MTRSFRLSLLWFLCSAALGGCGSFIFITPPLADAGTGTGGGGGGDGGVIVRDAGLPPSEACKLLNQRRCAYLGRCGLVGNDPAAQEDCKRGFEATWCGPTTWLPHVAAGALRFEPARAEDCAASFQSALCADWQTLPDSCAKFLTPRVPLGGQCFDGYTECVEGVCRGAACPRLCQARAVLGEVCNVDSDCRATLFCKKTLTPGVGQCAPFASAGEVCGADSQCGEGLRCVDEVCRQIPQEGAGCLEGLCGEGLWCEANPDGGTCVGRRDAGLACDADECVESAVCDPFGRTCVPRNVPLGEPCSALSSCTTGTQCVGLTSSDAGLCAAPGAWGDSCLSTGDCEAHLNCVAEPDAGTHCKVRAPAGGLCRTDADCQVSAACVQGTCVALPLPGEPCAVTRACRWGLCRSGAVDGGYVCASLLGPGARCARHEECGSGTCEAGACLARCAP